MDDLGKNSISSEASDEDNLFEKEKHFQNVNAELESKSAALIDEANELLKMQKQILGKRELNPLIVKKRLKNGSNVSSIPPQCLKKLSAKNIIEEVIQKVENEPLTSSRSKTEIHELSPEIGSDAMVRLLKVKTRLLQEELEKTIEENHRQKEEKNALEEHIKLIEAEKNKLQRSLVITLQKVEKFQKLAEDSKSQCSSIKDENVSIKKELNSLKLSQKQVTTFQNSSEVRLNRALEQIEKYKTQLQKVQQTNKDTSSHDKKQIEELTFEIRRLQKQKNELLAGFKKQMKLIDVLKKQKMQLEAAHLLKFTEEEFTKATSLQK